MPEKLVISTIDACEDCPHAALIYTGLECQKAYRDIDDRGSIPDWCPLPDDPSEDQPPPIETAREEAEGELDLPSVPTSEEADRMFEEAPDTPISEEEVRRISAAILDGAKEIDLDRLKEMADKATPGPWEFEPPRHGRAVVRAEHWVVTSATSLGGEKYESSIRACRNLRFIAATDPQTVLRLIADVERLRELEEDHRRVLAGDCASDERHCSCVPALRREVGRLTKEQRNEALQLCYREVVRLSRVLAADYADHPGFREVLLGIERSEGGDTRDGGSCPRCGGPLVRVDREAFGECCDCFEGLE